MEIGNKEIQKRLNHLKLILYLSEDYFSYSIFNTINNCFEKTEKYFIKAEQPDLLHNLTRIINNDDDLQKKYKITLCTIDNTKSTFIPEPLFDKQNIQYYVQSNQEDNEDLQHEYIKQHFSDCYNIFGINKNLFSLLEKKFCSIKFKSSASLLVDYALNLKAEKGNHILIEICKKQFHIIFNQDGKFKFYNKFKFDTTEDFLYYFMNCIHILGIDTNESNIIAMSELNKQHELFETLQKYCKISLIKRPSNFLYSNSIIDSASHKNHNLFSQLICE